MSDSKRMIRITDVIFAMHVFSVRIWTSIFSGEHHYLSSLVLNTAEIINESNKNMSVLVPCLLTF